MNFFSSFTFVFHICLLLNFDCAKPQEALENAEIVASDTKKYPIQDVLNAVHSAFKVNPKLACVKKGIIKEIYLCFDKQFKVCT